MRFMAPNISQEAVRLYEMPFEAGPKTKASVGRFAHMVPGLPDTILFRARETWFWMLLEGLVGPHRLTNVSTQASLAKRDKVVRRWYQTSRSLSKNDGRKSGECKAKLIDDEEYIRIDAVQTRRKGILFGEDDPLLKGFKVVLESTFRQDGSDLWLGNGNGWLPNAGHYPMEQKPHEITTCLLQFLSGEESAGINCR